jgi:hypothetical protein
MKIANENTPAFEASIHKQMAAIAAQLASL